MRTALWRRLDVPGHDACRLTQVRGGWKLEGAAVYRHENGRPARIDYLVVCDEAWHSRLGRVRGFIGTQNVDLRIRRSTRGGWTLNSRPVAGLDDCFDLDYGFTPATNLLQIERIKLEIGSKTEFPVAWIDVPETVLQSLPQHYERRSANTYWYESPTANYAALLELSDSGFVRHYPELWMMENEK
jgi:uncharacterized protein